jgi:phage gp46-like protein
MDFALRIDDYGRLLAALAPPDSLQNAVLLSLCVRRGAWFFNPDFGSRLHEITTLSESNVALARQYAAECLAWLTALGLIDAINVAAARASGGRLKLTVTLRRASAPDVAYETFFRVE